MTTELQALIDTSDMFDSQAFDMALAKAGKLPIPAFKAALQDTRAQMDQMFREGVDIRRLIYGRAAVLDYLLQAAWQRFEWPCQTQISLIAVGGYGRGELHPHSDIDLLILLDESLDAEVLQPSISGFLTLLWDINLDVGSSVRTLQECYDHSLADVTIATNLIESRCITGSKQLQQQMYDKVVSEQAWSAEQFLLAKLEEQQQRHQRTNNTEYNLEPNLKNSQGGLRDIQTIEIGRASCRERVCMFV